MLALLLAPVLPLPVKIILNVTVSVKFYECNFRLLATNFSHTLFQQQEREIDSLLFEYRNYSNMLRSPN